jgi:mRNA interferase MazF
MIGYKFGDIILVKLPFTDQTTTKKRPAVIISSSTDNQNILGE